MDRLFTMDMKALNHILSNSNDYQKPAPARYNLSRILGDGTHNSQILLQTFTLSLVTRGMLVVEGGAQSR
jgi:hypothetical protein